MRVKCQVERQFLKAKVTSFNMFTRNSEKHEGSVAMMVPLKGWTAEFKYLCVTTVSWFFFSSYWRPCPVSGMIYGKEEFSSEGKKKKRDCIFWERKCLAFWPLLVGAWGQGLEAMNGLRGGKLFWGLRKTWDVGTIKQTSFSKATSWLFGMLSLSLVFVLAGASITFRIKRRLLIGRFILIY